MKGTSLFPIGPVFETALPVQCTSYQCRQAFQCMYIQQAWTGNVILPGNFATRKPAEKLVSRWLGRKPDVVLDPVQVWDDIVANR